MKKTDLLILKSAIGPFLATFLIGNLVFLIQVMYQKIDDILGKGIGWDLILELIVYASFTLVPLTLPLAVLISSIMTMGNLGERYELVALKSAGVSLTRIMAPLIVCSFIMGGVAFYFSNTVMPYSKLKFNNLMWDVKNKKSVLLIKEGVFINDFDNMTLRVEEKDKNNILHDVTIYDHRKAGQTRVIKADSARIEESDTNNYLIMHLMSGKMHEDKSAKEAYTRFAFEELDLVVDMSSFALGNTDEGLFKNNASLKTLSQISKDRDSLEQSIIELNKKNLRSVSGNLMLMQSEFNPSITKENAFEEKQTKYEKRLKVNASNRYNSALVKTQTLQQHIGNTIRTIDIRKKDIIRHKIAWYEKFALGLSCVILFFIGAPMGALVRKGGFGLPIVISIAFYLLYYVINIIGKRLAEEQSISPLIGMWLSSILLIPVAIYLTRLAILDRRVNWGKIGSWLKNSKVLQRLTRK